MKDTGTAVTLSYAVGKAAGNVQTVQASMGNFSVSNQAFLDVIDTSTFTSNIHAQGYDGLLGLGPNQGSVIRKKTKTKEDTFLQRVFDQNHLTDNYITFLLDRKNDPGEQFKAQFSISEIIPGFEKVSSMPKLDVETVSRLLKADQHWQALTDEDNGIIGPDGRPIKVDSIVPRAPKGQFVAVIDSGFTFSQVPRDVSDAIYGRVRGAYYDSTNQWWLVPCGQYLNISFNFAGINYPIHPLDVVDDNFARTDSTGKKVCIGAFQPITSAFSLLGHYDMILGMSFLRNAYTLLNFGNWIDSSSSQGHPFMQMSPLSDFNAARKDFVQVRLGGNDSISDTRWSLLPADQLQRSPLAPDEQKKKYQEMILSRWPYILTGCLVLVILLVGLCVWRCCCRRRVKKGSKGEAGGALSKGGLFSKSSAQRESYVQLEAKNNHSSANLTSPFTPHASQHDLSQHAPHTPGFQEHDHRQSDYPPAFQEHDPRQSGYSQHNYQGGYHAQGAQAYQPQGHYQQGAYQSQGGYQGHGGYQGGF